MVKRTDAAIEQKIVDLYSDGYGCLKLSKHFEVHRSTVQRILISNKIKLRNSPSPQNDYDEYFFASFDRKSCYWAGFIAADGYIRNNKRNTLHIKLSKIDRDHLQIFLNHIRATYSIKDAKEYSYINVSGKKIISDLYKNFGIKNNKSLTLTFPRNIPQKFISHFIRGYVDGDGSIYIKTNDNTINFSIVGTEDMMDFMRKYFYYAVGVRIKSKNEITPITKTKNIHSISYSGKNAMKILNHIYISSKNLRLNRKYLKYLEIYNG